MSFHSLFNHFHLDHQEDTEIIIRRIHLIMHPLTITVLFTAFIVIDSAGVWMGDCPAKASMPELCETHCSIAKKSVLHPKSVLTKKNEGECTDWMEKCCCGERSCSDATRTTFCKCNGKENENFHVRQSID